MSMTVAAQADSHAVDVVHFADPWCFWSWGLEPILRRLKEVYGDQIKVEYRMGGITDDIGQWRKDYDVAEDEALRTWVRDSASLPRVPTHPDFYLRTKVETTWPACVAVKAAQMQSEELAERFLRRLMETIQVEAKNGNREEVYRPI